VDVWLPIHRWSTEDVWGRVRQAGTPVHHAYTKHGMPRLSCQLCPLASTSALVKAVKADPDKARAYRRVERITGHSSKHDLSISQIIEKAKRPTGHADLKRADTWEG